MTKAYKGAYFAPRSGKSIDVQIEVNDYYCVLLSNDGESVTQCNLIDCKLTSQIGQIPRELWLPDGDKVVLSQGQDLSSLEQAIKHNGNGTGVLHWLESQKKFWLMSLLLVPILFYFIVTFVIPAAAKSVVKVLPHEIALNIDNRSMDVMDRTLLESSQLSLDKQAKLSRQFSRLVDKLAMSDKSLKLLFRDAPSIGANAFALPGGTIVVTDDLVELLEGHDDAVMAIILHEIGHIEHQHGLQLMTESLATSIMLTYILGDLDGIAEYLSGIALTGLQNNFSRQLEMEADEFALSMESKTGISPMDFALAMEKLSGGENQPDIAKYLSSHPLAKDRIEAAKERAKTSDVAD